MTFAYTTHTVNGINLLLFPLPSVPAVKVDLMLHAGAEFEDYQKGGALHLLEHLVHQETQAFPSRQAMEVFKETHGLVSNGTTSNSYMRYFAKGPDYSLRPALEYINEVVFNPTLPEKEIGHEVKIIKQEYQKIWDNPANRFSRSTIQALCGPKHPYALDAGGNMDYIEGLHQDDLLALYHKFFVPANMVLVITGGFDPQQARDLIGAIIKPQNIGAAPQLDIPPLDTRDGVNFHQEKVEQTTVSMNWVLPGRSELSKKERLCLNIASYILGGTSRSILFQELREKLGIVYSCSAHPSYKPKAGWLEFRASSQPQNTKLIIAKFHEISDRFMSEPIAPDIFKRAFGFIKASTVMNFDGLDRISESVADNFFYENKVYLPADIVSLMDTITASEVRDTYRKYLTGNPPSISIMGPSQAALN